jgi:hypothetical protein
MISFLASPKPFRGNDKDNQYRAVLSWLAAVPDGEVILYGNSEGIETAGDHLRVKVVPDIPSAPSGAPFFGAIAAHAEVHAKFDLQVYLNCDILLSGIAPALGAIPFPFFLLIGERIDLDQGVSMDPGGDWRPRMASLARQGRLKAHGPTGIDYFGFRRGTWRHLPPVVIGRGGYDKALLVYCLKKRYPLVDSSFAVTALHQFHDYKHIDGQRHAAFYGDEARQNFLATGSLHSRALVSDAEYVLRQGRLVYWPCRGDRLRRLEVMLRFVHGWDNAGLMLRVLWRLLERFRLAGMKKIQLAALLNE